MTTHGMQEATADMKRRWAAYAAEVALGGTADPGTPPGELIILGSGIAHADVAITDETLILEADYVFHCLYDRVTQTWISQLRPDALDLRILYDPQCQRHETYVCMAEAMLHHVRRGRRVVAIYYGHPGIFATPTHRAIKIARREGHRATMRPGISALDHLVADVGFDPMIPGLLSYEASDLLLRKRRLDPTLHTVLWQVGTVGEFGFSPLGFENKGFDLLIDRLASTYGENGQVIHYIAPQYAGIDPLVESITISALRSEQIRKAIGALSTFYIAPVKAVATDRQQAEALGFPLHEQTQQVEEYDLSAYGRGERMALLRFARFEPPEHYMMAASSPAGELIMALTREPALLARYRIDPKAVVDEKRWAYLSDRARSLMAIQHPQAFNAAMAEPAAEDASTARVGAKAKDG